ncbi:MAG: hypothetical protein K0Q66_2477, partial [Chitinophagaceae bacterium]|nr:hypothetical protein [Chitinophagaceae bacterium]
MMINFNTGERLFFWHGFAGSILNKRYET